MAEVLAEAAVTDPFTAGLLSIVHTVKAPSGRPNLAITRSDYMQDGELPAGKLKQVCSPKKSDQWIRIVRVGGDEHSSCILWGPQ